MVAECDFGDPMRRGKRVKAASAQARAKAAHRLSFRDHPLDYAVGVLLDDVERHSELGEIVRQDMLGEPGLLLV